MNTPMLTMHLTGTVVFSGILGLAIYDLITVVKALKDGTNYSNSVSQFLITTAFKSPLISFAFGATVGHLWFYMWDASCNFDHARHFLTGGCGAVFGAILTFVGCQVWGRK
jgi:hypothetical protein